MEREGRVRKGSVGKREGREICGFPCSLLLTFDFCCQLLTCIMLRLSYPIVHIHTIQCNIRTY